MPFSNYRKDLWVIGFIFFIIGDITTTFFGAYTTGVTETNPLFIDFFENKNFVTMSIIKFGGYLVFIFLDVLLVEFARDIDLDILTMPIMPFAIILSGVKLTINNLSVLHNSGTHFIIVITTIAILSIVYIWLINTLMYYNPLGGIVS